MGVKYACQTPTYKHPDKPKDKETKSKMPKDNTGMEKNKRNTFFKKRQQ